MRDITWQAWRKDDEIIVNHHRAIYLGWIANPYGVPKLVYRLVADEDVRVQLRTTPVPKYASRGTYKEIG